MPTPDLLPPKIKAACQFEGLVFREVGYANGFAMPSHTHDEAHLFVCLQGAVRHDYRQQTCFVTASMLAFLPAGEPHATHFQDGVRTFDIVLKSPWVERLRQGSPLVDSPVEYQNGPVNWMAARLYREFQHPDSLTPLMLEAFTLELLAHMSRYSEDRIESPIPRWLRQAKDFLHAHFTESISLDAVAVAVRVHPDHLTRAFRQHYHCSIGEYVRKLRIEYACHLLATTTTPLSELAREAGFADQSHFSRTFKAHTGITPKEYQKLSGGIGSRQ